MTNNEYFNLVFDIHVTDDVFISFNVNDYLVIEKYFVDEELDEFQKKSGYTYCLKHGCSNKNLLKTIIRCESKNYKRFKSIISKKLLVELNNNRELVDNIMNLIEQYITLRLKK